MYGFVRSRQLEGTFPGDAKTGIWPITCWRIGYGGESFVPRIGPMQRTADSGLLPNRRAWIALQKGCGSVITSGFAPCKIASKPSQSVTCLRVSFEITEDWFHAERGVIPDPRPDDKIIGSHAVTSWVTTMVTGRSNSRTSGGASGATRVSERLSYDYYENRSVEAWIQTYCVVRHGRSPRKQPHTQVRTYQRSSTCVK